MLEYIFLGFITFVVMCIAVWVLTISDQLWRIEKQQRAILNELDIDDA